MNIFKKICIILIPIILFVVAFSSYNLFISVNKQVQREIDEQAQATVRSYSIGDSTELGTVIAVGHDKYALLESTDENGHQTWILEGGDVSRTTSTFLTGNAKFVTFTEEFFFYMFSLATSPDKIYLGVRRLEPIQNDELRSIFNTLPTDPCTTFPVVERVRYEGNEIWMELRYHISENVLSEDTVIYHLQLPESDSFEEVDTFE